MWDVASPGRPRERLHPLDAPSAPAGPRGLLARPEEGAGDSEELSAPKVLMAEHGEGVLGAPPDHGPSARREMGAGKQRGPSLRTPRAGAMRDPGRSVPRPGFSSSGGGARSQHRQGSCWIWEARGGGVVEAASVHGVHPRTLPLGWGAGRGLQTLQ